MVSTEVDAVSFTSLVCEMWVMSMTSICITKKIVVSAPSPGLFLVTLTTTVHFTSDPFLCVDFFQDVDCADHVHYTNGHTVRSSSVFVVISK
jgi:hypothetical protein